MAQWLSWLERRPVTAEVTGSSPVWVVHKWTTVERLLCILCINYGILAQLGEHLPYKQRVTGSSPVGPIFWFLNKITCRSGGTGRRPGLKIPWVVIPVPVRFRSAALENLEKSRFFCYLEAFQSFLWVFVKSGNDYNCSMKKWCYLIG